MVYTQSEGKKKFQSVHAFSVAQDFWEICIIIAVSQAVDNPETADI